MSKPKFLTPKFIGCAIRYVVYFLAVAITPFFAKPIAPLFNFVGYGLMRPLFEEVFTMVFWAVEWIIIFAVEQKLKRKAEGLAETESLPQEEMGESAERSLKIRIPFSIKIRPPLPLKNVFILTAISVVCIFILSAVIGFQVKPIYDIGEKVTGYEMYNKFGWLGKNAFKCFWILGMVKACKGMSEEIIDNSSLPENKAWLRWCLQVAFLLVFALFDVFAATMVYPLTVTKLLVGLTYLLFYVAFVAVQALTEGSNVKAFLLIVLIYLF